MIEQGLIIDKPIAKSLTDISMCIGDASNPGRQSQSIVEIVKYGYYGKENVTLVHLTPHTGRRHQLRVHMQSIGHPIVGDVSYEGNRECVAERVMLHALRISLPFEEGYLVNVETDNPFHALIQDEPHEVLSRKQLVIDETSPLFRVEDTSRISSGNDDDE